MPAFPQPTDTIYCSPRGAASMSLLVGARTKAAPARRGASSVLSPRPEGVFADEAWAAFTAVECNVVVVDGGPPLRFQSETTAPPLAGSALVVALVPGREVSGERGVFARRELEAGELLCEYVGRVVLPSANAGSIDHHSPYMAAISVGRARPGRGEGTVTVDAAEFGGVARFFNHSAAAPNVALAQHGWHLLLVTLRRVAAGEQLAFNYGPQYGDGFSDALSRVPLAGGPPFAPS